jgi:predicted nucleic acid-binding protein
VLGELFNVLARKAGFPLEAARKAILDWSGIFDIVDTTSDVLLAAADLAVAHRLQIWDAVLLSAASQAGCQVLLSEDMHEGFIWGGVTVVNPFAERPHPLLEMPLEPPAP